MGFMLQAVKIDCLFQFMKPTLYAPNVYTSNVIKSPVVYISCLLGIYYFNVVCTVHCIEHLLASDVYTCNICFITIKHNNIN